MKQPNVCIHLYVNIYFSDEVNTNYKYTDSMYLYIAPRGT